MEKIIGTSEYGLCVFSLDTLTEFLEIKKIRSKKVLALLQKKKDIYLDSIKDGVWMPIPSINSVKYVIKLEGYDDAFGDEWTQVLSYDGFNLTVKNGLWISDIGSLLEFDKTEYEGDGREEISPYGTVSYFSSKEVVYGLENAYGYGRALAVWLIDKGFLVKDVNTAISHRQAKHRGAMYRKSDSDDAEAIALATLNMLDNFDVNKWDGSDIFLIDNFRGIPVVTQKVKDLLEKNKIKNIVFTNIKEFV